MLGKSISVHSKSFLMLAYLLIFVYSTLKNNFEDIVKFVQFSFFKKWENENDLDLLLNGPNFMRNGIIISVQFIKAIFYKLPKRRYIFQPTKSEHKDVRESIDSDDTNLFSIGFAE